VITPFLCFNAQSSFELNTLTINDQ
jgi:hypothetical protein